MIGVYVEGAGVREEVIFFRENLGMEIPLLFEMDFSMSLLIL
jgi:hypothetical protein